MDSADFPYRPNFGSSLEYETFFTCPHCPTVYDFKEFCNLQHMSKPSFGEEPKIMGHAKCGKCSKDFYYYLSSDGFPILATPGDPPIPPELLSGCYEEGPVDIPFDGSLVPPFPLEIPKDDPKNAGKNGEDKSAQFTKALDGINRKLPPFELYQKMTEALDLMVTESPPQIEGALEVLARKFGLNARKVEAFRKEVNLKRDQIETDRKVKEINAVFSKLGKTPKELKEEERAKALEYLKDPNLFQNVSQDIARAGGVIGEETNKMMLYLAATSRKFKRPISLVIFGKSSSGKSYLANAIEQFMPDEETLVLSSMTAKSLEHADEQLRHKCLLIQEWEGLKEALPTLRVLQSEAKLSRFLTVMDPITKTRKAVPHDMECPCSVIVTTTKEGIHDENSTRIFELYADESVEQTRKVVRANIDKADMTRRLSPEARQEILDLHHNAQRLLEPLEVNVPFAEHLSFPAKTTRHRRESDRFINLIKVVAFLRQKQKGEIKTLNDEKYIDAEPIDYRIAYEIGMDVLKATLNTISNRSKDALRVCCDLNDKYMEAKKDPLFSVTEIQKTAEELGLDFDNRTDLYKQLDKLEEYEYLECHRARKNAKRHYKVLFAYERNEEGEIVNIDTPDVKEILAPEDLQKRLEQGQVEKPTGSQMLQGGGQNTHYGRMPH
jgi:hypothetical protein